MEFRANVVTVSVMDASDVVAFADDEAAPANYLIIQKAHKFDKQDVDLGQNTYHVELSGQDAGIYGGVLKCTMNEDHLSLELDPQKAFGGYQIIRVTRGGDLLTWQKAIQKIGSIFDGTGVLLSEAN